MTALDRFKLISEGIEWTGFCSLWQIIGVFYTVRNATAEERANPEVLAAFIASTHAQMSVLAITVMRLTDAVNLLTDDVDDLANTRRVARSFGSSR